MSFFSWLARSTADKQLGDLESIPHQDATQCMDVGTKDEGDWVVVAQSKHVPQAWDVDFRVIDFYPLTDGRQAVRDGAKSEVRKCRSAAVVFLRDSHGCWAIYKVTAFFDDHEVTLYQWAEPQKSGDKLFVCNYLTAEYEELMAYSGKNTTFKLHHGSKIARFHAQDVVVPYQSGFPKTMPYYRSHYMPIDNDSLYGNAQPTPLQDGPARGYLFRDPVTLLTSGNIVERDWIRRAIVVGGIRHDPWSGSRFRLGTYEDKEHVHLDGKKVAGFETVPDSAMWADFHGGVYVSAAYMMRPFEAYIQSIGLAMQ